MARLDRPRVSLPRHQQNLVEDVTRFLPNSLCSMRAKAWLAQNRLAIR